MASNAYFNNNYSYTTQSTLASPYAPPPAVVCDFGWYGTNSLQIFGHVIYDVAGHTYPPPSDTNPEVVDYVCEVGTSVTFDCYDRQGLGLPQVIVPAGYSIVEYSWNLGNGQLGQGPIVSTTYQQMTPDAAVTLTVTDSIGRSVTTTKRLNFILALPISGETGVSVS